MSRNGARADQPGETPATMVHSRYTIAAAKNPASRAFIETGSMPRRDTSAIVARSMTSETINNAMIGGTGPLASAGLIATATPSASPASSISTI